MPPEEAAQPTDLERSAATDALHTLLLEHSDTGGTLLRRLSHREYENSIASLFSIDFQLPTGFPTDPPEHGFDNAAEGLVISGPLMDAYLQTAVAVADQILPPPRTPVATTITNIDAKELVISYSSGAVIDGAMRLAARTDTMWRSATWPEKYEVQTAGTYRIHVSASRFVPGSKAWPEFESPMKLQLRARSLNGKDGDPVTKQRLLAEFEVTQDTPQDFSVVAELFPTETPVLYFANAPLDGDKGDAKSFAAVLQKMFDNDPRLQAGWLEVKHASGLRGGLGWDRVKAIRDSAELDLAAIDSSPSQVEKLIKKMIANPGLYVETVIYQFFEEGPALQIHEVVIEGPLQVLQTAREKRQAVQTERFLGSRDELSEPASLRRFLDRYLTTAFRRPASDTDIDRYTTLVTEHVAQNHSLEEGLHLAIRTSLMSPQFLYRGHRSGRLDDFDLATRLAYFLTSGPPDAELMRAATSGELTQPASLEKHARRLLKTDAHRRFVSDFTAQWLGIEDLEERMPDALWFPKFTDQHRTAMIEETERFFEEILQQNLPLETFIRPDFTFLNQALARDIYGRDDVKQKGKLIRVPVSPDSPHGGLLGQASVMMATANGVETQPVARGVWVLENILGDPPPPPPEAVPALTPDTRGAKTIREQLAAHRSDASCAGCHARIDPLGYVLENFDAIGRWRTHYRVASENPKGKISLREGAKIDAMGNFPGGRKFHDIHDLKRHVVEHMDPFANCLSEKLLTYATGRTLRYAERAEVEQIVASELSKQAGFQDLLIALLHSDVFQTK